MRHITRFLLGLSLIGFSAALLPAQAPFFLDLNFGAMGEARILSPNTQALNNSVATLTSDGSTVVVGSTLNRYYISRVLPNGQLDPSFGDNGKAVIFRFENAAQIEGTFAHAYPDGRILAGFSEDYANNNVWFKRARLIRLLPDGAIDLGFGNNGQISISAQTVPGFNETGAIRLQNDGKILLAGGGSLAPANHAMVIRLNPDGSLDQGFANGGAFVFDPNIFDPNMQWHYERSFANLIQVSESGRILAGMTIDKFGGRRAALLQLDANGALDADFGDQGLALMPLNPDQSVSIFHALEFAPDGKILAVGARVPLNNMDFLPVLRFVRFGEFGLYDPFFGQGGVLDIPFPNTNMTSFNPQYYLNSANDGWLFFVGYAEFTTNENGFYLMRTDLDLQLADPMSGLFKESNFKTFGSMHQPGNARVQVLGPSGNEAYAVRQYVDVALNAPDADCPCGSSVLNMRTAPNPARDQTWAHFSLSSEAVLQITLVEQSSGRRIALAQAKRYGAGDHIERLDLPLGLPAGLYYAVLTDAEGRPAASDKLMILK